VNCAMQWKDQTAFEALLTKRLLNEYKG
jgi:hypothetical protein